MYQHSKSTTSFGSKSKYAAYLRQVTKTPAFQAQIKPKKQDCKRIQTIMESRISQPQTVSTMNIDGERVSYLIIDQRKA
jgi:hypothetical protein